MGRSESPPFARGKTANDGNVPTTTPPLDFSQWLGKTWVFEDLLYNAPFTTSGSAKPARTGRYVKCMAVRNVSGGNLLPGMLAVMNTGGGVNGVGFVGEVSGYPSAVGQVCFPIDEFLPAAGVVNNDVFWVVVEGPASVITDRPAPRTSPSAPSLCLAWRPQAPLFSKILALLLALRRLTRSKARSDARLRL